MVAPDVADNRNINISDNGNSFIKELDLHLLSEKYSDLQDLVFSLKKYLFRIKIFN